MDPGWSLGRGRFRLNRSGWTLNGLSRNTSTCSLTLLQPVLVPWTHRLLSSHAARGRNGDEQQHTALDLPAYSLLQNVCTHVSSAAQPARLAAAAAARAWPGATVFSSRSLPPPSWRISLGQADRQSAPTKTHPPWSSSSGFRPTLRVPSRPPGLARRDGASSILSTRRCGPLSSMRSARVREVCNCASTVVILVVKESKTQLLQGLG